MSSASKQYPQKFRSVWLQDPLLKDWLTTVENKGASKEPFVFGKCLYCDKILFPRYRDLLKHSRTTKHTSATAERKELQGN